MAEWSFPQRDVGGDRTYSEEDFAQFFANLFTTGIFFNVMNKLHIKESPTNSMNVIVESGAANINGKQYLNTSEKMMTVPIASSTQNRTDSVVVRMDKQNRIITTEYKAGDVSVVRSDMIYELQLATILVPKNSTVVTNANITDTRSNTTTGGYSSPFESVPVSGLEQQYAAILQGIADEANANKDANNTAQQQALQNMQATFQSWFADLQDVLSGDVAANLAALIGKLLPTHDAGVTITHTFNGYPKVHAFTWDYGLGMVGLGDEPTGLFGGSNVINIDAKIEYLDPHSFKVWLDDDHQMLAPTVTNQGSGHFLLTEGYRSVGLAVQDYGYKN